MKRRIGSKHSLIFALAGIAACGGQTPPAAAPAPVAVAAEGTRQTPPPPMPLRPVNFPPFEEMTLPSGLRVLVVEDTDQPVVNVDLYVGSGAATDPAERAGLAKLAAGLLTQGTAERSAAEIAETIEGVGGDLSATATDDYVRVSATALSDQLPLVFDLVSDVTLRPSFPADEVEIARRRELSGLQFSLGQAAVLADRQFLSAVYGPGHPYGRLTTPATVRALSRDDLVAFHRERFRPGNALLVVSGDAAAARVRELAQRHFGEWTGGGAQPVAFVEPPARGGAEVQFVHRPGSAQANLMVGHTAIRPDNPDYFPLQVMNKILGAGTDARLFLILREQKGWTYGAYSRLSRPKDIGYFSASAEVRNAVADSALAEIMTQLRRIREAPVALEELEAAKSFLVGSFPLRIETPGQIARQVADVRLLGIPAEFLTDYRERIAAVTAEDVQRVAQRYVRPDRAVVVVVGDATQVLDEIEALGIGPVRLVDVEGKPLERAALEVKAPSERFDASRLQPQVLEYAVMVQGNPMGAVTTSLEREGDGWKGVSTVALGPMNQTIETRFGPAFEPRAYSEELTGALQGKAEVDVRGGRFVGEAKLPPQAGGEKSFDVAAVEGAIFDMADRFLLSVADLAPGKTITLPVFLTNPGSVVPVTYKVTGAEEVTVPAGTFRALRIEEAGKPQPSTWWVRADAPHILLRQELAGQPVAIELKAIR